MLAACDRLPGARVIPDIMTFEEWQKEFDHPKRWFTALRTDPERRKVFNDNIEKIKKQNALYEAGLSGYKFGVNQFADLTAEEFGDVVGLGRKMAEREHTEYAAVNATVPDEVDWRNHGAVTPVKNQGQCGSCWSFSTTGSVEGSVAVNTGKLISVSEKQLVDCSTANHGCQGGLMDYAFQYIIQNGGLTTEANYPYQPVDGSCNTSKEKNPAVTITGYKDVTPNSATALMSAIATSPVSIAIEADKEAFQLYSGGVLDSAMCGTQLDHGVLAVGYTSSSNAVYKDAFIVKNSWGPSWGVQGYIYISKSTKYSSKGICGILSQPSFATGGKTVGPAPGPTPTPGSSDYENPWQVQHCRTGEFNITLPNTQGSAYCAPECTKDESGCPMAPTSFNGVTTTCTVKDTMTNQKFCGISCNPYAETSSCGDGSTCIVYCDSAACQWLCSYKPYNLEENFEPKMKKPMAPL